MEFYQKLRNIRKENGMSQEDLADQLGVSRQAVSKWESGQGFPETEKLLQISSLYSVSLDYLLKDDPGDAAGSEEPGFYANREMVDGFLQSKRQKALQLSIGVAVIILSIIFVFIPGENRGNIFFLLGAAVGTAIIIAQAFRPKRYGELESQPLLFDSAFLREFRNTQTARRKRFGWLIVLGVVLVLLSCIAALLLPETSHDRAMAILPPLWAIATFLFINAGSALNAEGIIANNAAHMEEQEKDKRNGWVWGSIMPLASMIFLAIGFIWNAWHPGWLVFPVAAMLCVGITGWREAKHQTKD